MNTLARLTAVLFAVLTVSPALGQWSTATLSAERMDPAATTVGSKALFAGGTGSASWLPDVDIYDDAIGTWSTASLSVRRWALAATTVGGKALFAGGREWIVQEFDVVDIYNDATGTWSTTSV